MKKSSELASKIRRARLSAGLLQKELADKIGVSNKSVSAYETGRAYPPTPILSKIADATDSSVSDLLSPVSKKDLKSSFDFYSLIRTLKKSGRQGWAGRGLKSDTMASHIFGAISLGLILAKGTRANENKVTKMLLVQDLVMARMKDISPTVGKFANPKTYQIKGNFEEIAKRKVYDELPETIKNDYLSLFNEYQQQKSIEAKIAREADKLETLLQGDAYEKETNRADILDEFLHTFEGLFTSSLATMIFSEIKSRHLARKKSS